MFYVTRIRGCGFYEGEKRGAKMVLDILSDFDVLWITDQRKNSSIMETKCTTSS
jgi:hypothetical protein